MKIDFQVEGLEELSRILRELPKEADEAAGKELKRSALDLQGKSQMLAPVKLGDLRGSAFTAYEGSDISTNTAADQDTRSVRRSKPTTGKMEAAVGFTEPYALRQHEEVENEHPMGGQAKYLEQPFKENVKNYIKNIGEAIKKAVEK